MIKLRRSKKDVECRSNDQPRHLKATMKHFSFSILSIVMMVCFTNAFAHAQERPNIIFLMTDDQRCDNLACYGRPEFKTPNIDNLAKQGVLFENAFYAVSICMPSRVTMLTGRYASNHKVGFSTPYDYSLSDSDFSDSYVGQLKQAGYRTGFVGKFGFVVTEEAQRPNHIVGYNFEKHLRQYFDFFISDGTHTGGDRKIWPHDDAELNAIYDSNRKDAGRTVRNGDAMLHFVDTQPDDQPFCLSVSFHATKHDSDSHMVREHFDMFKDYEFSVPDNWVEGANPKLPQVVKDYWRGARLHVERTSTPELYQRQVRRFAAQGYTVDQQVGRLMEKLKEKGLLSNTIVIYTSDNGRFQGSHGLFDKALLYEESVKEPLIIFDGRSSQDQRDRREKALISSVDIAPTILSLANAKVPASMQGNDFSKILKLSQEVSNSRTSVFMEQLFISSLRKAGRKKNPDELNAKTIGENKSYRCHGVRTNRWKYFVYYEQTPKIEELYDLQNDPHEQNNLINNPEFAKTLAELRQQTATMYAAAKK